MKIAIMTVPFNNNYGGYLQAFALKYVLRAWGHEVIFIIRRRNRIRPNRWRNLIKYLLHRDSFCQFKYERQIRKLSIHTSKFERKYLKPWTKEFYNTQSLRKCRTMNADVFIAGSDQCWRPKFAQGYIDDYFFNFLEGTEKKRISYAASFGTDELEFSYNMQCKCSKLLKEFSALSVRESSGKILLERYFGIPKEKVQVVLDPTLLLTPNDYSNLIKGLSPPQGNYLFTYILDEDEGKRNLIRTIAVEKGLEEVTQKAQTGDIYELKPIEPVELWLSRIFHASYVVTDSFHGMIFSVLFNKPFLVYGNKKRGATRFVNFLTQYDLLSRYIDDINEEEHFQYDDRIDWGHVNELLSKNRLLSLRFLITAITS